MDKAKTITIDPKMFISPPFLKCPKCGKDGYGVLMVSRHRYTRRCRECWHTESYSLPKLQKKIIYLDQMVISEMMKLLHPKIDPERKKRVKSIWNDVFAKLDRLVKLQLIICPDSSTHRDESLVSPHYKALRRMYEQLSNGTSFYDEDTIQRFQVTVNFKRWLGKPDQKELDVHSILHADDIEGWQDKLRVSVDLWGQDQDLPDRIRSERNQTDQYMQGVFKRWQKETLKIFNDWYKEEIDMYGHTILKSYVESVRRFASAVRGEPGSRWDHMLPSSTVTLVSILQDDLRESGVTEDQILPKTTEYFSSEAIKEVPYGRISAMLFAAMARKAASGKKKPPTRGMVNDVKTIASLAPYCDTMFIDKECHAYLNEEPLKSGLGINTKFFSQIDANAFLLYLDQIEKDADREHLKKVEEVYGETWGEPFIEMYDYE